MKNVIKEIMDSKLYGVVREDDTKRAIEVSNAYIEAGIKVVEMNTNIDAIKEIRKNNPDISIAAGGIITSNQALDRIEAGADLLVSPILQMGLVKLASWNKIPLILTATTPNEAYTAWKARVPLIKIYPVKDLGGKTYIEDLLRPMKFLNVMPSGSIDIDDIKDYLEAGASAVALGRNLYKDKTYQEIIETTKLAIEKTK